jgi:HEAT repeat protein
MGLFDFVKSMFGVGGCKMELALDAEQVAVGGVLSGRCTVIGSDKDWPLTSVKVRLLYVSVETQEDSALPKIDTRILIDNTIASNEVVPANGKREYDFTLQIPGGTEPNRNGVSYTVMVVADIPGLKDPSAKKDLKVVELEEGAPNMDLAALYSRWPALQGSAEGPLVQAIRDLGWSHSDYDDSKNMKSAEPVLAKFLRHESSQVRSTALEAWSRIIGEEATPANIRTLQAAMKDGTAEDGVLLEAIEAAARFAKSGGIGILEPFAKHEDPKVRKKVAWSIGNYANDVGKGLMLIQTMMADTDIGVLTQVVESLSRFSGNGVVMQKLNDLALTPEMPVALRRELGNALGNGYEFPDIVWPGLKNLADDTDPETRRRVAQNLHSHTQRDEMPPLVSALLQDGDAEVRRTMTGQIRYFPNNDHMATYRPILEAIAEGDADRVCQANAVYSLSNGMTPEEKAGHYQTWMAKKPTEEVLQRIVHDIMYDKQPEFQPLLTALSGAEFPRIAEDARTGLAYEG